MIENKVNLPPKVFAQWIDLQHKEGLNDEDINDLIEYKLNYYRVVWSSRLDTKQLQKILLPSDLIKFYNGQYCILKDKFNEFKETMKMFRTGKKFKLIQDKMEDLENDFK